HLASKMTCQGHRHRAAVTNQLMEIHPIDVFHGNVISAPDLIEIVNDNNVGMGKLGGSLGLLFESLEGVGILRDAFLTDYLERDQAIESVLLSLENLPHASLAQFSENGVARHYRPLGCFLGFGCRLIGRGWNGLPSDLFGWWIVGFKSMMQLALTPQQLLKL